MRLTGVQNALLQLYNGSGGDVGKNLVGYFENDDHNAYITENSIEKNYIDVDGENMIYLNKNLIEEDMPVEGGKMAAPPIWISVGHELAHRQDYIKRGKNAANQVWLKSSDGTVIYDTEKYATHVENQLRSATSNIPLRTHYAKQGAWGYRPSRIINRKGKSLFYKGVKYIPLKERNVK